MLPWLTGVPLRGTADAVSVTWFSIEVVSGSGKRTYHSSFVTDLPVTAGTVAELAACARARWKIESAPQAHRTGRLRMT